MISHIGCRHAIAGRLCKSASRYFFLAFALIDAAHQIGTSSGAQQSPTKSGQNISFANF